MTDDLKLFIVTASVLALFGHTVELEEPTKCTEKEYIVNNDVTSNAFHHMRNYYIKEDQKFQELDSIIFSESPPECENRRIAKFTLKVCDHDSTPIITLSDFPYVVRTGNLKKQAVIIRETWCGNVRGTFPKLEWRSNDGTPRRKRKNPRVELSFK
ncbi:uncharacterized protein LOC142985266 [Anticarsia gemmatalis]|uniref:uncharacterized protein LOC142985266 n=1 Tax=Anticarsia gemmatalis TaxID=129554 RepID=UPI003F761117